MNRISKKRLKKIAENDLIGILEKTHNLLNTSEVNSVDEFKELYK